MNIGACNTVSSPPNINPQTRHALRYFTPQFAPNVLTTDTVDVNEANLTLGNIGGTLGVAKGGSGATTLTGYLKGNGTAAFTASATIPNTDISGLGTMSTQAASSVAITGGSIDGIILDGGTF